MTDSVLIQSGSVIDGLGNDPVAADVLITGNRIAQIGADIRPRRAAP